MKNQTLNLGQLLSLVKYPSLTEKSINLYGNRQYTFVVDRTLTKTQIKYLIEKIFNIVGKKITYITKKSHSIIVYILIIRKK